jgi:small subunit ribosomal protein S4
LENELIKKYGLKNKKEIWKAETRLKKYRTQARELLAKVGTGDPQIKKESSELLIHLDRVNILPTNSTLDDVLALNTESILSRRLQTLTYLKGLANTPTHARQLISHGHIAIGAKRVNVPSYMVTRDEEGEIGYTADSPLNDTMHPARPKADFRSTQVPKISKPEESTPPKTEKGKREKPILGKPEEKTKQEPVKPEEKPKEPVSPKEDIPSDKKPEEKPAQEPPKPEEKPKDESEKQEKKQLEEPPKKAEAEKSDEKHTRKEEEKTPKEDKKKTEEDKKGDS